MYGDTTLDELQHRALSANQDLKVAVARVDENRAHLRVAKSARYPALNLGTSYERTRSSENSAQAGNAAENSLSLEQNSFRATIDGSYELDLWGKVRRTVESAAAQSVAVEAARDTVLLNLTADVAENYFNLRSHDAEIVVLERTLSLREKALTVNQSRLDTGAALPADVSQAETELANVQSDLSEARRREKKFCSVTVWRFCAANPPQPSTLNPNHWYHHRRRKFLLDFLLNCCCVARTWPRPSKQRRANARKLVWPKPPSSPRSS